MIVSNHSPSKPILRDRKSSLVINIEISMCSTCQPNFFPSLFPHLTITFAILLLNKTVSPCPIHNLARSR